MKNTFSRLKLEGYFNVLVHPNAKNNDAIWSDEKQALIVNIKAKPENNKANDALVQYLSKLLKKDVRIVAGARSKKKLVKFV